MMINKKNIIQLIVVIILAAFTLQNIAWTYPDIGHTKNLPLCLQVPSIFDSISEKLGEKILETTLKYLGKIVRLENFGYRLKPTVNGMTLDFDFSQRYFEGDVMIVPCSLGDARSVRCYEASINPKDNSITLREPRRVERFVERPEQDTGVGEEVVKGIEALIESLLEKNVPQLYAEIRQESGEIASGDPEALYRRFLENENSIKECDIERRGFIDALKERCDASDLDDQEKDIIKRLLETFENVRVIEFDAVILQSDAADGVTNGWLFGFNTILGDGAVDRTTAPHGIIELLRENYSNTIGLSKQVLTYLEKETALLDEYLFHEILCPHLGHERTREIQEILFNKENYPKVRDGDTRPGHQDGDLTGILKRVIFEEAVLTTENAHRLAEKVEHIDRLKSFGFRLNDEQNEAVGQLINYPVDRLISDMLRYNRETREYRLSFIALSWNMNMSAYEKVMQAYLDTEADSEKKKDLADLARFIQYSAINFNAEGDGVNPDINRRTWPGRAERSISIIEEELKKFRIANPEETFVIGDFAVSDGTSALELARHFEGRNVLVIGSDRSMHVWHMVMRMGRNLYSSYFDSEGNLQQLIDRRTGSIFNPRKLSYSWVKNMENHFKGLMERGEVDDAENISKVSLVNPEVQEYADSHPDKLKLIQHDAFKPFDSDLHFARITGLLMRGRYSYFKDDRIRIAVRNIGRALSERGVLLNGTFWSRGAEYDIFRRDGNKLKLDVNRSIFSQDYEGWEEVDLNSFIGKPIPDAESMNISAEESVILEDLKSDLLFKKGNERMIFPLEMLARLRRMTDLSRELSVELQAVCTVSDGVVSNVEYPDDEKAIAVLSADSEKADIMNETEYYLMTAAVFAHLRHSLASLDMSREMTPDEAELIKFSIERVQQIMSWYGARITIFSARSGGEIELTQDNLTSIEMNDLCTSMKNVKHLTTEWWSSINLEKDYEFDGKKVQQLEPDQATDTSMIKIHTHPKGYACPPSAIVLDDGSFRGDIGIPGFFAGQKSGIILDTPSGNELFLLYEENDRNQKAYVDMFDKFWGRRQPIINDFRTLAMKPHSVEEKETATTGKPAKGDSPDAAFGKGIQLRHNQVDIVIELFQKKLLRDGKYYEKMRWEQRLELDSESENAKKVARAIQILRARSHGSVTETSERADRMANEMTVVEVDVPSQFLINGRDQSGSKYWQITHIGKSQCRVYLSKKFLDELDIDSETDMKILATILNHDQYEIERYWEVLLCGGELTFELMEKIHEDAMFHDPFGMYEEVEKKYDIRSDPGEFYIRKSVFDIQLQILRKRLEILWRHINYFGKRERLAQKRIIRMLYFDIGMLYSKLGYFYDIAYKRRRAVRAYNKSIKNLKRVKMNDTGYLPIHAQERIVYLCAKENWLYRLKHEINKLIDYEAFRKPTRKYFTDDEIEADRIHFYEFLSWHNWDHFTRIKGRVISILDYHLRHELSAAKKEEIENTRMHIQGLACNNESKEANASGAAPEVDTVEVSEADPADTQHTAAQTVVRTSFIRDLTKEEELMTNLVEAVFTKSLSGTVVLAFDEKLGGVEAKKVHAVFDELADLKKDDKYKKLLENVVIIKKSITELRTKISEYSGTNAEVFVFAREAEKEALSDIDAAAHSVFIDEGRFPEKAYYPLAEIVTITLSHHIDPSTLKHVSEMLQKINIESIDEDGDTLIFKLLPDAEEIDRQELIKKYARLKRFLRSA